MKGVVIPVPLGVPRAKEIWGSARPYLNEWLEIVKPISIALSSEKNFNVPGIYVPVKINLTENELALKKNSW